MTAASDKPGSTAAACSCLRISSGESAAAYAGRAVAAMSTAIGSISAAIGPATTAAIAAVNGIIITRCVYGIGSIAARSVRSSPAATTTGIGHNRKPIIARIEDTVRAAAVAAAIFGGRTISPCSMRTSVSTIPISR